MNDIEKDNVHVKLSPYIVVISSTWIKDRGPDTEKVDGMTPEKSAPGPTDRYG